MKLHNLKVNEKELEAVKKFMEENKEHLLEILESANVDFSMQHAEKLKRIEQGFEDWYTNNKK